MDRPVEHFTLIIRPNGMIKIPTSFAFRLMEILISLVFALISTAYMAGMLLVLLFRNDQKAHT